MTEGTGLGPAYPCKRRFSRPQSGLGPNLTSTDFPIQMGLAAVKVIYVRVQSFPVARHLSAKSIVSRFCMHLTNLGSRPALFAKGTSTSWQKENRCLCEVSYSRDIGAPSPSRGGGRRSPTIQSPWRSSAAPCRGCRTAPPPARRRTARDSGSARAAARPRTL